MYRCCRGGGAVLNGASLFALCTPAVTDNRRILQREEEGVSSKSNRGKNRLNSNWWLPFSTNCQPSTKNHLSPSAKFGPIFILRNSSHGVLLVVPLTIWRHRQFTFLCLLFSARGIVISTYASVTNDPSHTSSTKPVPWLKIWVDTAWLSFPYISRPFQSFVLRQNSVGL